MGVVGREAVAEVLETLPLKAPPESRTSRKSLLAAGIRPPTTLGTRLPPAVNLPGPAQQGPARTNCPRLFEFAMSVTIVPSLLLANVAASWSWNTVALPNVTVPSLVTAATAVAEHAARQRQCTPLCSFSTPA